MITRSFINPCIILPFSESKEYLWNMRNRYILLLFNYSFHSPEINQCLYHYFKSMFNYIEEENNATSDEDFNDQHQQDIQAILRPRLYCVLVLEVFNRIMHDPAASHSTGMNRKDIEDLASLGRDIVGVLESIHCSLQPSSLL